MARVERRSDDILIVRGMKVDPRRVGDIFAEIEGHLPAHQILVPCLVPPRMAPLSPGPTSTLRPAMVILTVQELLGHRDPGCVRSPLDR